MAIALTNMCLIYAEILVVWVNLNLQQCTLTCSRILKRRVQSNWGWDGIDMDKKLQETIRSFDRFAEKYEKSQFGRLEKGGVLHSFMEHFISKVKRLDESPILDAGCGWGKCISYLAERGYYVVGVDLSAKMLKLAKTTKKEKSIFFELCKMDLKHPAFRNEVFRGVWSCASIHYVHPKELEATLKEFSRILLPGGMLFIGTGYLYDFKLFFAATLQYLKNRVRGKEWCFREIRTKLGQFTYLYSLRDLKSALSRLGGTIIRESVDRGKPVAFADLLFRKGFG